MKNTETLLTQLYPPEDVEYIQELFQTYDLVKILRNTVNKLKKDISRYQSHSPDSKEYIPTLAGAFLTGVNNRLSLIKNKDDKTKLEHALSDIAFELLYEAIAGYRGDTSNLLSLVKEHLETICDVHNYDKKQLFLLFPLHRIEKILAIKGVIDNPPIIKHFTPVYYQWLSTPDNLHELASDLKSKNIIDSVTAFKKLFNTGLQDLRVRFNQAYRDTIIILFDELKSLKLLSVRGNKGHFVPLRLYAVDFENKFLLDRDPKVLKYTIKKNKAKYAAIKDKVSKWLSGYDRM